LGLLLGLPLRLALPAWRHRLGCEVSKMAKLLIAAGLILVVAGLVWLAGERLGLGRLPGDIVIEREGTRIYIPLATSLIVSVVLSLVLWFLTR